MNTRLPVITDTVTLFVIMLAWIWTLKFEMIEQTRKTDYFHKKYDEERESLTYILTEHVAKCECDILKINVASERQLLFLLSNSSRFDLRHLNLSYVTI